MAVNKFQRSRLTFDLSAKSLILVYLNMIFSQTIGPIELKYNVKTPYAKLAKIYSKYFGHMTKMAAMPIYGKSPLNIFFSRSKRQVTLRLGM